MKRTRRDVLAASIGIVLVAGCSDTDPESDPEVISDNDGAEDDSDSDSDGSDSSEESDGDDGPVSGEIEVSNEPFAVFPDRPVYYHSTVEITETDDDAGVTVTEVRDAEFVTDGSEEFERHYNITTRTDDHGEAVFDEDVIVQVESSKPVIYRRTEWETEDRELIFNDYPEPGDRAIASQTWTDRIYELFLEDATSGSETVEELNGSVEYETDSFEDLANEELEVLLGVPSVTLEVTPMDADADDPREFEVISAERGVESFPATGEVVITDEAHVESLSVTYDAREDDDADSDLVLEWELNASFGDAARDELASFPGWADSLQANHDLEFTFNEHFLAIENTGNDSIHGPFDIRVKVDDDSISSMGTTMHAYLPSLDHPAADMTDPDNAAVPVIELEPGDTLYLYRVDSTSFSWDSHAVNDPEEAIELAGDSPFGGESNTIPAFEEPGTGVTLRQLSAVEWLRYLYNAEYHDEVVGYYEANRHAWTDREDELSAEITIETAPEVNPDWDPTT